MSPSGTGTSSLPLVIVDAANVVGSVPDGWWRDRHAATERLRTRLSELAVDGLDQWPAPLELVLVVEGAARGVESVPSVEVVAAPGSGDDEIVALVAGARGERDVLVVSADRELRERVARLGAEVTGPRAVRGG